MASLKNVLVGTVAGSALFIGLIFLKPGGKAQPVVPETFTVVNRDEAVSSAAGFIEGYWGKHRFADADLRRAKFQQIGDGRLRVQMDLSAPASSWIVLMKWNPGRTNSADAYEVEQVICKDFPKYNYPTAE